MWADELIDKGNFVYIAALILLVQHLNTDDLAVFCFNSLVEKVKLKGVS